jgi:hypothetical protein
LPAQFIYLFIFNFSHNKKTITFVLISQILSVASFYFWYRISVYSKGGEIYTWMTPPSLAYIRTTIQLLLNGKLLYYLTFGLLIFFILKLFLTERQGIIYREKFKKISLPFLWWFIPFVLTIIVSYLFKPFFAPKYLVYVIPGFILMNAFIISNIQLKYNYIIKTLLVVLIIMKSAVNIVEIKRSGVFNLEKWKQAVQFIKERESSNSIILGTADYQMASFVYYYNKDYFKNINKTKESLKSEDIYFFRGVQKLNKINYNQYDEVILVYSHEEVVDPEKKIKNTIEQNYHLSDVFNTPKVKVFIYKKEDNTTREFYIDYENMNNQHTELYDSAPSGKRVSYVDSNVEYSAGINKEYSELSHLLGKKIIISAQYLCKDQGAKASLVCSVESGKEVVLWKSAGISCNKPGNNWKSINLYVRVPDEMKPNSIMKVYLWNNSNGKILIDDLMIKSW